MYIERMQVEEGFLDGLDLHFSPGLNTVIGARGAGKSSLIELIRFCLDSKGHTGASTRRSFEHAVSVLKGGRVTVTLRDGEEKIIVSRTADQDVSESSGLFSAPIVFSQSEIEAVGLDASGRLRLIDGFVPVGARSDGGEVSKIGIVRSLTNDASRIRQDIVEHEERLGKLPELKEQLKQLAPDEEKVAKVSSEAAAKAKKLEALTKKTSAISVGADYVKRFRDGITEWHEAVHKSMDDMPILEPWGATEYADPLVQPKKQVELAETEVSKALEAIVAAREGAEVLLKGAIVARQELDDQSRTLRSEIESLQAGAGEIIRRGQKLREEESQLEALRKVVIDKKKILEDILGTRADALSELEAARQKKFTFREKVVDQLSEILFPQIRIEITHAQQVEGYAAAIADALRGSGLKYKDLASEISGLVSPRELIQLADENNGEVFAEISQITKDRAFRVLASLRSADLGELATIELDDEVLFQLLHGGDYKNFTELSTGQRCTVILPIILEHRDRVLMIDQPEDHIDNAFIADTLISAISRRSRTGQIILTTHNANIPVLGDAERVIHLGSDGRRGYVLIEGSLDDPNVVDAITTVMEGGAEAFRRRAEFYKSHSHD